MKYVIYFFMIIAFVVLLQSNSNAQITWQNVTPFGPAGITKGSSNNEIMISYSGYSSTSSEDNSSPGIIRTTNNGANWTRISSGLPSQNIIGVFCNSNGVTLAGTHLNGTHRSTNFGTSWLPVNSNRLTQFAAKGDTIFATDGYWCTGIYRSFNAGLNWTTVNNGNATCCNGIAIALNGTVYVATGTNGMYKSTNWGNLWISLPGTSNNASWVQVSSSGIVYAGTVNGIFKSTNEGTSWINITAGLPGSNITRIAISSSNDVYVGIYLFGLYQTTNEGNNWINISSGIVDAIYPQNLLISNSGYLYVLTNYVHRSNSPVSTGLSYTNQIPSNFNLSQNCPNPFNPTTQIRFDIPKSSFVKLTVFDVLGKEISMLVNEELKAGEYSVDWNAENFPSGVYFYKLVAEDFAQTRKMILLR